MNESKETSSLRGYILPLGFNGEANSGPRSSRVQNWGICPSKLSQTNSVCYTQADHGLLGAFSDQNSSSGNVSFATTDTGYIPRKADMNLSDPWNEQVSTESVEKTYIPGHKNVTTGCFDRHVPKFHPQIPQLNPSLNLVGRPVLNRIDLLPQQISKAFLKANPETMFAKPGFSLLEQPKIFPSSPEYKYISTPQSHDQEMAIPQQKGKGERFYEAPSSAGIGTLLERYKVLPEVKESFKKFAPLIRSINCRNSPAVLVDIFSQLPQRVSLDEFCNSLYNQEKSCEDITNTETSISESPGVKLKELILLNLVVLTFKYPRVTIERIPKVLTQKPRVSSTKYEDLLRTFLAVKILCTTTKKGHISLHTSNVSRIEIYKTYCIVCHQLIRKYPVMHKLHNSSPGIIVSQTRLGKIINSVYPKIIQKRLGRRGYSKTHYIGLQLNRSMVDTNLQHLLDLDISKLKEYLATGKLESFSDQRDGPASKYGCVVDSVEDSSFKYYSTPSDELVRSFVTNWENPIGRISYPALLKHTSTREPENPMGKSIIWQDLQQP